MQEDSVETLNMQQNPAKLQEDIWKYILEARHLWVDKGSSDKVYIVMSQCKISPLHACMQCCKTNMKAKSCVVSSHLFLCFGVLVIKNEHQCP